MNEHHINDMIRKLKPVLKDAAKAKVILKRYWHARMALVWEVADVHRAANEREVALSNPEAITVLEILHEKHNAQYGIKWEDLTAHIQDKVLGRKLTKAELNRFVHQDRLTVQK